jgi:hypothetical protein
VIVKLTSDGALVFDKQFDGKAAETGDGVAVAPDNTIYVGGTTTSFGAGDQDAFVLHLEPTAPQYPRYPRLAQTRRRWREELRKAHGMEAVIAAVERVTGNVGLASVVASVKDELLILGQHLKRVSPGFTSAARMRFGRWMAPTITIAPSDPAAIRPRGSTTSPAEVEGISRPARGRWAGLGFVFGAKALRFEPSRTQPKSRDRLCECGHGKCAAFRPE